MYQEQANQGQQYQQQPPQQEYQQPQQPAQQYQQYPDQQQPQQPPPQEPPQQPQQPPQPAEQPTKAKTLGDEFKKMIGDMGWGLVKDENIADGWYLSFKNSQKKLKKGDIISFEITIKSVGATQPPTPGQPAGHNCNIGIKTLIKKGFFGKDKRDYVHWINIDNFVADDFTPIPGLDEQIRTFLIEDGIHKAPQPVVQPTPQQPPPQQPAQDQQQPPQQQYQQPAQDQQQPPQQQYQQQPPEQQQYQQQPPAQQQPPPQQDQWGQPQQPQKPKPQWPQQ